MHLLPRGHRVLAADVFPPPLSLISKTGSLGDSAPLPPPALQAGGHGGETRNGDDRACLHAVLWPHSRFHQSGFPTGMATNEVEQDRLHPQG